MQWWDRYWSLSRQWYSPNNSDIAQHHCQNLWLVTAESLCSTDIVYQLHSTTYTTEEVCAMVFGKAVKGETNPIILMACTCDSDDFFMNDFHPNSHYSSVIPFWKISKIWSCFTHKSKDLIKSKTWHLWATCASKCLRFPFFITMFIFCNADGFCESWNLIYSESLNLSYWWPSFQCQHYYETFYLENSGRFQILVALWHHRSSTWHQPDTTLKLKRSPTNWDKSLLSCPPSAGWFLTQISVILKSWTLLRA